MSIEIKPENKGKFTSFCKSKGYDGVTSKCISAGLNSKSAIVRQRANFARNASKWNH